MPGPYNITPLTLHDKSVTVTATSAQVYAGDQGIVSLILHNPGSHTIGVNLAGGDASIGGAGTVVLPTGALPMMFDAWVPQNKITCIGTANDVLVVLVGTKAPFSGGGDL